MREDILQSMSKEKNVSNVIILTHNIDYIFIQTVVLKYLKKCGNPSLTIFADAQCAQESYDNQKSVISGLGKRYRVVPVYMMRPYDRFHPKAILLSGEEKASLFIGSGNMTFGGWRQNAEIWNHYDTASDDSGLFHAFKNYLDALLQRWSFSDSVKQAVAEAYDPETKSWARSLNEPSGLIGRIMTKDSLLKQMENYIEPYCSRLVLHSPYFDKEGKTIAQLNDLFQPEVIEILAQSHHSELSQHIIDHLHTNAKVISADFFHEADKTQEKKQAFVHAKFYAFESADKVVVFSGSANCSQAAMALEGTSTGNAELMTVETMSPQEFYSRYLDNFHLDEERFMPMEVADEEVNTEERTVPIRIVSAQREYGRLKITYISDNEWEVFGCKIGAKEYVQSPVSANLLIVEENIEIESGNHVCLMIRAKHNPSDIRCSNELWIDHEIELGTSAKTRSLGDFIQRTRDNSWGYGQWGELIKIFNEHLAYTPKKIEITVSNDRRVTDKKTAVFDVSDVFVDSYRFQPVPSILSSKDDVDLYAVLRQYLKLGNREQKDEKKAITLTQEEIEQQLKEDNIARETLTEDRQSASLQPNERERTKLRKLIDALVEAFTNADIIENRPLNFLLDDLKVASIILRMGMREHWLTEEEFFNATYTLWTKLFFFSEKDTSKGYLDLRLETEETDVSQLQSPELSATMLAWLFAVPPSNHLKYIRLLMSAILMHAKYEWIFVGGDADAINEELHKALGIAEEEEAIEALLSEHTILWKRILMTGKAFSELLEKLEDHKVSDFKDTIEDCEVKKGALLWQGGEEFYIVKSTYMRMKRNKKKLTTSVVSINSSVEEKSYLLEYTVPIRKLFDLEECTISKDAQRVIDDFTDTYLSHITDII